MEITPTFLNPPVVEFVLGVQFSPLDEFTSAHFGLFWSRLNQASAEWTLSGDAPWIEDRFETFDAPAWVQRGRVHFRVETAPRPGRICFENESRDRMIQVQASRFHLNWRKTEGLKPSYKSLITEFESRFEEFRRFCEDHRLGTVVPNQWEITYVDSFPQGEYWNSHADWATILPGLFGRWIPSTDGRLVPEQRSAESSCEIRPRAGRLHVSAQTGTWESDPRTTLLLNMTCRGSIESGKVASLREGLDLGHRVSVETFLQITSQELHALWDPQP